MLGLLAAPAAPAGSRTQSADALLKPSGETIPDHGGTRSDILSLDELGMVPYFSICHGDRAPDPSPQRWALPEWQNDTTMQWARLPAQTHLLLVGTSHIQVLAGALRAVSARSGALESTETVSYSNPCVAPGDFEPEDAECQYNAGACYEMTLCGPDNTSCALNAHSIVRDRLEGGSTVTTIGNHAQSSLNAEHLAHWLGRLTREQRHNFTHGAFLVPHMPDWFAAQCEKERTGKMPDPNKVGDRVEACGNEDDETCPTRDPRYDSVKQFVQHELALVIRPKGDTIPNDLLRLKPWTKTLRRTHRTSTVFLEEALAPELAPQDSVSCACDIHLCNAKCWGVGTERHCATAEGIGAAWLVLRAAGLTGGRRT